MKTPTTALRETERPSQAAIYRWCKARVNPAACTVVIEEQSPSALRRAFDFRRTSQGSGYWYPIIKGDKPLDAAAIGRVKEARHVGRWIEGGCQ